MAKNIAIILLLLNCTANAKDNKLEQIIENNILKVCVWPNYYGISYLNQRTQKLEGIDSDLAQELAKDLNVTLEFIPSSFATLISDITTNKCDIAMFSIGNTKSRREKIRFTTSHLSSDIYAITSKSNKKIKSWNDIDKKGIVVSVAKGTYHESVMKKKLKNAKLVIFKTHKEREIAVQSGRADVFMTDYPFGKRMLSTKNGPNNNWAKLIIPNNPYHITEYAWAIAYKNDNFYNRIEQFILDIKKDGRLLDLSKKNGLESIIKLK